MGRQHSLESRIKLVKDRVNAACIANGRSPNSVMLLVSKTANRNVARSRRLGLKRFEKITQMRPRQK